MIVKLELTGSTDLKNAFEVIKALEKIFININKINLTEITEVK